MESPLYSDSPQATDPRDGIFSAKDLNELAQDEWLVQWYLNSKLLCLVLRIIKQ